MSTQLLQEIPVFRPSISEDEIAASEESLRKGWLGMGSYVGQFEEVLDEYLELEERHVVAVSTGHAALHLSLLLAGVGPGDEVITPSFNNIADFQAILATGAEPVFCDIDDETLCVDLDKAQQLVGERTKAIIVMDYDCLLCDHERVAQFADVHHLRVVHDAAHSFGSRYQGRMIGSFSDMTMFSFDPVKTITTIDGGALVVRSEEEAERVREMRLIGMGQPTGVMYQDRRAWTYDVTGLGFRYHMANLHAAIGLAQMGRIEEISSSRRESARFYNDQLAAIPDLRIPQTNFDDITPFLYYVRVPAPRRDAFRDALREHGIDTGIHWQPGHWFTLLKDCRQGDLSTTERVGREIVSLPLHSFMEESQRQRVVDAVCDFFGVNL